MYVHFLAVSQSEGFWIRLDRHLLNLGTHLALFALPVCKFYSILKRILKVCCLLFANQHFSLSYVLYMNRKRYAQICRKWITNGLEYV